MKNVEDKQIKSEAPVKHIKIFKCKNCEIFGNWFKEKEEEKN